MQLSHDKKDLTIEEQQILNSYNEYFFQIEGFKTISDLLNSIPQMVLQFHKIGILQPESVLFIKISKFRDIFLDVRKQSYNGLIYLYDLILGYFHLKISLLNFNRNADQEDTEIEANKIGMGGFGTVRICQVQGKQFAVKRIYFKSKIHQTSLQESQSLVDFETSRSKYAQIKRAIRQYGIYKICSMLDIGPKVIFEQSFDLHCFNDCIEFYMQLCQVPCKAHNFLLQRDIAYYKLEKDLKLCLLKMHMLKIIHKDIKSDNVLYSSERGRFILTDFGLTHTVQNQVWQSTLTTYSGTIKYSSPEMINLYNLNCSGMVNLYMNDIHSLGVVFEEFRKVCQSGNRDANPYDVSLMSRNSMSFADSYSNHYSYGKGSNNGSVEEANSNADSIVNTGSSLPILPTNNTNSLVGPAKYSSDINFYEASAIYTVSNKFLDNPVKTLNIDEVSNIVQNVVCLAPKAMAIKEKVLYYLNATFFPETWSHQKQQDDIKVQKNRLSFYLRGYGPDSPQFFQAFGKITGSLTPQSQSKIFSKILVGHKIPDKWSIKDLSGLENKQAQIKTTLHKSRSSLCQFKYLLRINNESFKQQSSVGKADMKLVPIYVEFFRILADYSNVLLEQDMEEIIDLMNCFINLNNIYQSQKLQQSHQNSSLNEIIKILEDHFVKSKILQEEKKMNTVWHRENSKIIKIIKLSLKCLSKVNNLTHDELFNIIKLNLYVCHKRFSGYQFFNSLFLLSERFSVDSFQAQLNYIQNVENPSVQMLENTIKTTYFSVKLAYMCTNDYSLILERLNLLEKLKSKLKQHSYEALQKTKGFYRDFFVEIKLIAYIKLCKSVQAEQEIIRYFKQINLDMNSLMRVQSLQDNFFDKFVQNAQKILSFIAKSHQVTLIQKISIIKIYIDTKLQEQNNFQEVKKIYELCYETLSQNYSRSSVYKIVTEITFNFCVASLKLWEWKNAMLMAQHLYQDFKRNSLNDAERQIICICTIFIDTLTNFQFINGEGQNLADKTPDEIQLINKYNQKLPEVIDRLIKQQIKGAFKFQLFQHFQGHYPNSNHKNILDIRYPIKKIMTLSNKRHQFNAKYQANPSSYKPGMGCRNIDQINQIKKLFLRQCAVNRPYMQWNYRQYSLEIGFYYKEKGHFLTAVKYFWNYVEPLFQDPSQCTNQDFDICIAFVDLLIKTNCSYRRALKFLKMILFYIPPSEFMTRKIAYQLYNRISSELCEPKKTNIEAKWIKQICRNGCQLLLSRDFEMLIQFQELPETMFVNRICNKWAKKL